ESEIPCYLTPNKVIEIVKSRISSGNSVSENLRRAYQGLQEVGIVSDKELGLLDLWLQDVQVLTTAKQEA
ncbi:MAG TPA: hypothetical protein VIQ31_30280, partial [Phormidium sp.]